MSAGNTTNSTTLADAWNAFCLRQARLTAGNVLRIGVGPYLPVALCIVWDVVLHLLVWKRGDDPQDSAPLDESRGKSHLATAITPLAD
ncbi:MAG: hypothetical protein U0894_16120 [Pirellulales bacterium]